MEPAKTSSGLHHLLCSPCPTTSVKGRQNCNQMRLVCFSTGMSCGGAGLTQVCKLAKLIGRKVMTNLDSIFKSRDITLPTKVRLVEAMVFPVIMYGCESWTVKKAEHRRIDAFELWCWRRKTLESPMDCKEIQPVHSNGDQSWVSFERNDAEAETPVLWPPHEKS